MHIISSLTIFSTLNWFTIHLRVIQDRAMLRRFLQCRLWNVLNNKSLNSRKWCYLSSTNFYVSIRNNKIYIRWSLTILSTLNLFTIHLRIIQDHVILNRSLQYLLWNKDFLSNHSSISRKWYYFLSYTYCI